MNTNYKPIDMDLLKKAEEESREIMRHHKNIFSLKGNAVWVNNRTGEVCGLDRAVLEMTTFKAKILASVNCSGIKGSNGTELAFGQYNLVALTEREAKSCLLSTIDPDSISKETFDNAVVLANEIKASYDNGYFIAIVIGRNL